MALVRHEQDRAQAMAEEIDHLHRAQFQPPSLGSDEIMPKTLATATVDRLLHHAHVVVTQGDSFRVAQATSGQGGKPLRQPALFTRLPGR